MAERAGAPRLAPPAWLGRDLRLLFAGRALRSLSQGYLNVIVPIYLVALGYSAVRVGVVFTAGSVGSLVLTAAVGLLADRLGRRTLLVGLGLLAALSGLAFALSPAFGVLLFGAAIGTVGRGGGAGAGGAFGPYFPAEQALIAELAGNANRTSAFGVVSVVGVLAGAAGSLVAALPSVLHRAYGVAMLSGVRALFFLTVLLGVAMTLLVIPVHERPRPPRGRGTRRLAPVTRRMLPRFLITSAVNGLAVGMLGPVVVYWFHVRYGATPAELGALYFVANLMAVPANLLAPVAARRLGAVRAIVGARGLAAVLLPAMALMPLYWLAGAVFLARTAVNSLSTPIRQSFLMGVVDEADRSTTAGLSNVPLQAVAAAGPTVAGQLMQSVWLELPLVAAGALQVVYTGLYYVFFRNVRPPEEADPGPAAG